ncbi:MULTISPECIES: type 1 periplasmic-binding domain-containing protein [Cysteiniphilum]|uniref:hypothetical protein n=1 Tax=Cysteiniphilum TaxID=2056696 RepID=UPI00177EEF58|nr:MULTISPECIES: hypothetical protein [Cysteiniphilum]
MKCNKTFKSKLIYALITIAVILSLFVVERVNRFANDGDVGVIISNMDNPFFSTVTRSIHHTLQDGGHDVVVFSSKDDPLRSIQSMENLVDRGFKVIILAQSLFPLDGLNLL